jgi:hypothetical protein
MIIIIAFLLLPIFAYGCQDSDCGYLGFCTLSGCRCSPGYSLVNGICEADYLIIPNFVLGIRIFCIIVFAICFIASIIGIIGVRNRRKTIHFSNMIPAILMTICICSFSLVLYFSIDPFSYNGIFPICLNNIFYAIIFITPIALYCLILFQWIELYRKTIKKINKEKMIAKINSKYEASFTIEEILEKISFFNRTRILSFIFIGIGYIIEIISGILRQLNLLSINYYYGIFKDLYEIIFWTTLIIGFFIYSRKLTNIMPLEVQSRMRRSTKIILILSIFSALGILSPIIIYSSIGSISPIAMHLSIGLTTLFFGSSNLLMILFILLTNSTFKWIKYIKVLLSYTKSKNTDSFKNDTELQNDIVILPD